MDLKQNMEKYKNLTLELMDRIEEQGNRLYLLQQREDILNEIKNEGYNQEELQDICNELGIVETEHELKRKVADEMLNLKKQMKEVNSGMKGSQTYMLSGSAGLNGFDRKF